MQLQKKLIDPLVVLLSGLAFVLLLTGGVHFEVGHAKIELSQLDPFTIPIMLLLLIRYRPRQTVLPLQLSKFWGKILRGFEKKPTFVLCIAFITYVALYSFLQIARFDSFNTSAFDLSYVDQALWSTAHGKGFLHSNISRGGTYLGEHFSPILALLAPAYMLWDSVHLLFILQSILLGSSVFLVFQLAKIKQVPAPVAVTLSLCLLLYHPLRAANAFDLREDNFFVPVFLCALIFLEKKRWPLLWFFCFLSWTIKENASLFTLMLSLLIFSREKKRLKSSNPAVLNGLLLFSFSILVFWIINSRVTPYFSGPQNQTMLARRLSRFGSSNSEVLSTILAKPYLLALEVFKTFFSKESFYYLLAVLTPFIAFARKSKPAFLTACTGIAFNLAMGANKIGYHYECIFIPFLFYALIEGVQRSKLGANASFLVLLSFFLFFGRSPVNDIRGLWPTARDRWIAQELRKIPGTASVATQSVIHPHLTHRESITMISSQMSSDYIVADLAPHRSRYANDDLEKNLASIDLLKYEKIVDKEGFFIWRRR
jgi:uncharacterized membrane protein